MSQELIEKIPVGVIIIEGEPPKAVSTNPHFHHIARGKEDTIIETVLNDLEYFNSTGNRDYFRCDMSIDNQFVIGYTIYQMNPNEFLVFLNDISYKKIYFENKGDNRFYDRLSGLLAEVVHEIGNPLTALTTTLQVLYEYMENWDIEKQRTYVSRAVDEIDRLSGYLDRMRRFSRIDVPYQQSVLLAPIITRVIGQNRDIIDRNGLSLEFDVDDSQKVMVDEDLLYQVLLNLVLNSVDILPPDTGKIYLGIEEVNEFFVKLVYLNNGPPIPDDLKDKVFLPFYSSKEDGYGIGLAVSLKLMIRMGGSMKIEEPDEGWGVKFVMYVPVSIEQQCEKRVNSI